MGWRSDWLYQLIFAEVEKVWMRAKREGAGQFGPPPTAFCISEMAGGDWEHVRCRGDACRRWLYQGDEPEPASDAVDEAEIVRQAGMFYERGGVEFFIDSDRKRVLFTYTLGPRYGLGMTFGVTGQGTGGNLTPCAGPAWVS